MRIFKRVVIAFGLLMLATSVYASGGAEAAGGATMTHRMMMLVIQLGVILFAAKLGSVLFERLNMPGVLGELTAGILIGPYLLGGMKLHGFPDGLFPVFDPVFPVSPELYGICSIASIVLLFMVGLETDINLFLRYSVASSLVGVGGVIVSFLLGNGVATFLLPVIFGTPVTFMSPECLLLGVISTATSVGITARVLSEKKKIDSPEGVTILSGAVIDDVLGIILLAVAMGVITASKDSGSVDWNHISQIAVKAVGIWLAATVISLLLSRRISVLLKYFKDRSSIAIMALGMALMLAGLFEQAGLAMIVGAYIMGLSLSKTDISHVIMEKLHPVYRLLIPVFFTVMGMLVDLSVLTSPRVLLFSAVYTLGAVIAKVVGCGVPALFVNFNLRGALRIGFGMLPRGEVALIIAGVGLSAGLLRSDIFGVAIVMTMATTLVAPVALVALFKNPDSGLRRHVAGKDIKELVFDFPSFDTADLLVRKLLSVFESDGFFVHLLDRSEGLYQFRRDEIVIGMRHEESDIVFDCQEKDVAFVHTAMMEVMAELEQTVKELRKPIDVKAIGLKVQDEINGVASKRSIGKYLSVKALQPRLMGHTKEAVLDELLQLVKKSGQLKDIDEARKAVWAREESMSTGMQYGIAIPHGRTDAVENLACAIGITHNGIDFSSIDGELSKIIVLTLSPKSAVAPHVQFMSMISQVLNKDGRDSLMACETPKEMYDVLTGRKTRDDIDALIERQSVMELSRIEEGKKSKLSQYLKESSVVMNLKGRTRIEVIAELLDVLVREGFVQNAKAARIAVLAREKRMSSGLEHGVAIPHARTDAVNKLVCAIGIARDGVDFDAIDSRLSNIIVLTLSPLDAAAPHVQFMAMISRALNAAGRECVLGAASAKELYDFLMTA